MNFVIGIIILTDWKENNYDMIFVMIDCLTKIIYHKLVKITIDTADRANIIIKVLIKYYSLFNLIISNQG